MWFCNGCRVAARVRKQNYQELERRISTMSSDHVSLTLILPLLVAEKSHYYLAPCTAL
jgi:hypothetical protein